LRLSENLKQKRAGGIYQVMEYKALNSDLLLYLPPEEKKKVRFKLKTVMIPLDWYSFWYQEWLPQFSNACSIDWHKVGCPRCTSE
jgi:hypothetical protein